MAEEVLEAGHQERTPEPEAESAEKRESLFRRLWARAGLAWRRAWRWLLKPNEVGRPITLRPSGVRLLVLLIVGNLIVLGLLSYALYQATSAPTVEQSVQVIIATPMPTPTPIPGPSPTPFGSGGAIAFTMRRNGNADIYAFNQVELQPVQLTHDPAEDRDPAWSPDGDYIAFASNRSHNWDIYLLDLVSGKLIRETQNPGFDSNPTWSPDGEYIAFESYRYRNLDIYMMSTTTGQVWRITTDRAPDYEPAWSPDSRAIAFTSLRNGNKDICLYLVEENRTINVTNSPDLDEDYATWSPDGAQLAYVAGSRGNPSIQVMTFDWDTLAADQAQTELLGAGTSPVWAPDGQNLLYVTYERGERSHLIAASMTSWGQFQKVYSADGLLDDLAWTNLALSPRVVARAQAAVPTDPAPLYVELVQPPPATGPPYQLVPFLRVSSGDGEEEEEEEVFIISDRVDESFDALRQRVVEEAGWDYLANLGSAWQPMTYTPPSGHSRMNWHVCGRAIGLNQEPYEAAGPQIELVREDVGNVTYWRIFIRTTEQDGSMGEPLRETVWDLNAREEGGSAMVEGGALKERVPSGYYVDLTVLAGDYGWKRVPSLWRWRYSWPDIRWWELEKTDSLTWWECMLEIYEPAQIEAAFGPIPGYRD